MNLVDYQVLRSHKVFIWQNVIGEKDDKLFAINLVYVDTNIENVRKRILKNRDILIDKYGEEAFGKVMSQEPSVICDIDQGRGWNTLLRNLPPAAPRVPPSFGTRQE
jgi:hypothetical protein